MAEHRSLGFLSCFILKSTLRLLINREVKASAFPAAASQKVSHLLWLPEQRLDMASACWWAATLVQAGTGPHHQQFCAGTVFVDGEKDHKPWLLRGQVHRLPGGRAGRGRASGGSASTSGEEFTQY